MRSSYPKEFYKEFNKGMVYYLKGQWEKARKKFEKTKFMIPNKVDGPSCQCLKLMSNYGFMVPSNWKGY